MVFFFVLKLFQKFRGRPLCLRSQYDADIGYKAILTALKADHDVDVQPISMQNYLKRLSSGTNRAIRGTVSSEHPLGEASFYADAIRESFSAGLGTGAIQNRLHLQNSIHIKRRDIGYLCSTFSEDVAMACLGIHDDFIKSNPGWVSLCILTINCNLL